MREDPDNPARVFDGGDDLQLGAHVFAAVRKAAWVADYSLTVRTARMTGRSSRRVDLNLAGKPVEVNKMNIGTIFLGNIVQAGRRLGLFIVPEMFNQYRLERLVKRIPSGFTIPLRIVLWNGRAFNLSPEPTVTIHVPKPSALRYLMPPDLNKLGTAFVEGHIRVEGSIHELFRVAESLVSSVTATTRARFHWFTRHSHRRDREAIEYHYDVSNDFYSLFLDRNMVYSCAYYRYRNDSLETAQEQKLDHILNKLMLTPGERFLDIGCGWGALILRAARKYGAVATGITLSRNQFEHVQARIQAEGLQGRCTVRLLDYRDLPDTGVFDKIASIGMFEHVGLKNLPVYFRKICALLTDEGLVLNHGITTTDVDSHERGSGAGEFIDTYVFPEGELPHLSLALKEMSAAGLEVTDAESLRRHYALTCHEWANRLESHRDRAIAIAGRRRFRIWEIYLAGCAHAFSHSWINVYQVLARKSANSTADFLPLTREYMYSDHAMDCEREAGR